MYARTHLHAPHVTCTLCVCAVHRDVRLALRIALCSLALASRCASRCASRRAHRARIALHIAPCDARRALRIATCTVHWHRTARWAGIATHARTTHPRTHARTHPSTHASTHAPTHARIHTRTYSRMHARNSVLSGRPCRVGFPVGAGAASRLLTRVCMSHAHHTTRRRRMYAQSGRRTQAWHCFPSSCSPWQLQPKGRSRRASTVTQSSPCSTRRNSGA